MSLYILNYPYIFQVNKYRAIIRSDRINSNNIEFLNPIDKILSLKGLNPFSKLDAVELRDYLFSTIMRKIMYKNLDNNRV